MQLDIAVRLSIDSSKVNLPKDRQCGFDEAGSIAKELCDTPNIEPELKEKRRRSSKRQFAYKAVDEPLMTTFKSLRSHISTVLWTLALLSLQEKLEAMNQVKESYGVLLDFSKVNRMSKVNFKNHCREVHKTLNDKRTSDNDGAERMQEIINLPQRPPPTVYLPWNYGYFLMRYILICGLLFGLH